MEENPEVKLTIKEDAMLLAEGLIGVLPCGIGTISSLFFNHQREVRMKRIEHFMNDIVNRFRNGEFIIASNLIENKEAFMALFEDVVDRTQKQQMEGKREYLKNYFISLLGDENLNYDRSMTFLRILDELTYLEAGLLKSLYERKGDLTYPHDICMNPENDYEIIAAFYHLQNNGLIISATQGYNMIGDGTPTIISNNIELSNLGSDFVEYLIL